MRSLRAILVIAVGCFALAASTFSPSRAAAAVQQLHAAVAPHQTSIRRVSYDVTTPSGASRIVVVEARRTIGGTTHVLTVVLAPEHLRGTAFLVDESRARDGVQWIYAPAVGRVPKS